MGFFLFLVFETFKLYPFLFESIDCGFCFIAVSIAIIFGKNSFFLILAKLILFLACNPQYHTVSANCAAPQARHHDNPMRPLPHPTKKGRN